MAGERLAQWVPVLYCGLEVETVVNGLHVAHKHSDSHSFHLKICGGTRR